MILLMLSQAWAWDSVCKSDGDLTCEYGLQPARERWNHPVQSEHWELMRQALTLSGVPPELDDPITFKTWTDGEPVGTRDGLFYDPLTPRLADVAAFQTREMTPSEFAQLPDFSYGVYDWVSGNETCIAFPEEDLADQCHAFTTHTGALNSSHFLPQARAFWEHYHQLALDRAEECAELWLDLGPTGYADTALACEQEAMVFEAVAQHYLQDAWSSGHMWERFGGPELEDWPSGINGAQAIGAVSGLTHGAKAVVEDLAAGVPLLPQIYDDPLCGPHWSAVYEDWETEEWVLGVGDLFNESHLQTEDYDTQRRALLGCSVNSLLEVYRATGQGHGEGSPPSSSAYEDRDPNSSSCWGQRATNSAMGEAWGLHSGSTPNQTAIFTASAPTSQLSSAVTAMFALWVGPILSWKNPGGSLSPQDTIQLQRDYAMNTWHIMLESTVRPSGLNVAEGDLLPMLDTEPNGFYEEYWQEDPSPILPIPYIDPQGPWGVGAGDERKVALNLGFFDAHAPDRCSDLEEADLLELVDAVLYADDHQRAARCSLCAAMLAPHVRAGTGPTDFSEDRAPLCDYTGEDPAFLYSGDRNIGPPATLAARICGCAEGLGIITRDTGDDTLLFANRIGDALELRGDYFPTGESPRDAAMGGTGNQVFVTAGEHLAVYVVTEGGEHEVDIDDDLDTMTDGAPVGVSRLELGGAPRGVALQHTGRYGLVATADAIVVIDQWDLEVEATYAKSFLGFTSQEKPYDIAITHDDQRAFVTAYGAYPHLANEVMVLDLSDLPYNLALETTFITGGDTQNQFLEISPDGSMLAVTCPEIDSVKVFQTSAPYDKVGNYTEEYNEQGHYPIAVDWSLESDAVYVGYLSGPYESSLSGNGVVRKCYIDEPENCEHAVGVTNTVRDLLVTPEGIVWVGDDGGNLTPLSPELFDPGETTSGYDQQTGLLDGTGGCLDVDLRAEACPVAAQAGRAVGALVSF